MAIQIQGTTIIDDSRNLLTLASLQVKGSSTGYTTILSGNAGATNYTLTIPAVTGNIVTTGDTGTVTNTMLAGSIANAKLANSSITINGSSVSLGGSLTLATFDASQAYYYANF